ncbi:hypothetical protein GOBAR_AA18544 [Gossypium barbadense]|uniref:N-acetyltransferase domain-containing protein n=1 Tax=Gossypium barbadense TaxID=3634 RepID=A0A2P5XFK8_GOSBA|nr:hypothetical protein GOBAR_AA18544 [Gossypium barbadense]
MIQHLHKLSALKFKEANHNLEDPPCRLGTSNEALAHRPNLTSCHPELPLIVIVIVKDISSNYFILVLLVLAAAEALAFLLLKLASNLFVETMAVRRPHSFLLVLVPFHIMIIQRGGSGAAFPSKSMELRWIRSNSRRKNSNLSSREFGGLKSIPPPLVMPIYISTDPSHINIQELSELYTCCNHSCHQFPKVDPQTGIVQEVMDLDKLHIALSHSCVVVSVFCKPQHVKVTNTTKQNQSQEQQEQIKTGLVGDLMENVMPVNPSNGQLVGFGRAVSDLGLTASIYDVMVVPTLQGMGIGTIIVKRIVSCSLFQKGEVILVIVLKCHSLCVLLMLTSRDIYDIAALCSRKERFFFKACGFRDDILGSTTMMYSRTVSSTCFEGGQMVKQAGRKLLLVPSLQLPLAASKTTKPQS